MFHSFNFFAPETENRSADVDEGDGEVGPGEFR